MYRQLAHIGTRTRCNRCHKVKAISNFSNKQQLDLKHRIAGPHGEKAKSAVAEIITCRTCTGGPVNELTCSICGEVKGLDGFSKAQRRDPDRARCILCLHEQSEEHWAHTDVRQQASDDDTSDDDSYDETATNPYTSVGRRSASCLLYAQNSRHPTKRKRRLMLPRRR